MDNYRFFLEPHGTVYAAKIITGNLGRNQRGHVIGVGATLATMNAPCGPRTATPRYLRDHCTETTEREARRIHPGLFEAL